MHWLLHSKFMKLMVEMVKRSHNSFSFLEEKVSLKGAKEVSHLSLGPRQRGMLSNRLTLQNKQKKISIACITKTIEITSCILRVIKRYVLHDLTTIGIDKIIKQDSTHCL